MPVAAGIQCKPCAILYKVNVFFLLFFSLFFLLFFVFQCDWQEMWCDWWLVWFVFFSIWFDGLFAYRTCVCVWVFLNLNLLNLNKCHCYNNICILTWHLSYCQIQFTLNMCEFCQITFDCWPCGEYIYDFCFFFLAICLVPYPFHKQGILHLISRHCLHLFE